MKKIRDEAGQVSDSTEWRNVAQLASWLKVTKEWIYDQVQSGDLPVHRLGRQLRFRDREVEAWLEGLNK